MVKVTLYQGEAKTLPFRIRDKITRNWIDLRDAICFFIVKRSPEDAESVITKDDADFIKAGGDQGYLSIFLGTTDTWLEPWTYDAEIKIVIPGLNTTVNKVRFDLEILQAVY
jgi:hypothetical protein